MEGITPEVFDRKGKPISYKRWAELNRDESYKRVARTVLSDGTVISTVWLGLNHQFGFGLPVIFETMVFRREFKEGEKPNDENASEMDMDRYSTEEEAIAGHKKIVHRWLMRHKLRVVNGGRNGD